MFRKALAVAVAALCASAATANNLKAIDITSIASPGLDFPGASKAVLLKPGTLHYRSTSASTDSDASLVVKCPAPKNANARIKKAFTSYIALTGGSANSELYVYNADGKVLGEMNTPVDEGQGSLLVVACVNGVAVANDNAYSP